jgi:thymidylate synthase
MLKFETFADLMEDLIIRFTEDKYDYETAPRGKRIREIINYSGCILNPYAQLIENKIRSTPIGYLAKELILYFSGENKAEYFEKASKFWGHIKSTDKNGNEYIESAYGNLIFNPNIYGNIPIDWVYHSLVRDKDSRQAILHYNNPGHLKPENKDVVCTMYNQFIIRDNRLHMIVNMRSNDIIRGLFFDTPYFMCLQQVLLNLLKEVYPGLKMGYYYHNAGSMHVYEEHFDLITDMNLYTLNSGKLPLIVENPIKNEEIIKLCHNDEYKYEGKDKFIKYLSDNRNK